jgi:predicted glycogen debranching enzyme
VFGQPLVHFGPEIGADLANGLRREWLVTNGLGGYASGTICGINTRRYHGLLVAALIPPVERTVLVGGSVDWATYDGRRYPLCTHEYGDGTVDPRGFVHLESFALEGTLPVWTFALADALVERRVWMTHGANTTWVTYRLLRGNCDLAIDVTPLVTYRGFHSLSHGGSWQPAITPLHGEGIEIRAFEGAVPFRVLVGAASYTPIGAWFWNFLHRAESERGLDDRSDLFAPGKFSRQLRAGEVATFILTTESQSATDAERALHAEQQRQRALLEQAAATTADPVVQQLVLAADQFVAERTDRDNQPGKTIIAGYHWFNDWGRDTMIALPGLTLSTGRAREAANILRTFAGYVDQGMLPNNFPDESGALPGFNTVDATLWYVQAIAAYEQATGDPTLVDELLPLLRSILDWHVRGTRYGIGMDPNDGLLRAGEPGVQLTWMDAKVNDWVVTPRIGKPVEINALWYNALRTVGAFLETRADAAAAADYQALAQRARAAFLQRFWHPEVGYLADVVDGPDGDDLALRPNQILSVSLPFPLVSSAEAAAVLDAVGRALFTGLGLRSLSPDDPAYRGDYGGDQVQRDGAYHQGPVWTWLIGAYTEAHFRVHRDRSAALALLRSFEHHLCDAGLGSVSEILEGNAPHLPRGCIAQAWGVAEVLRVWRLLTDDNSGVGVSG